MAEVQAFSAITIWDAIPKIDAADYVPILLGEPISGKLEVTLTCLDN